MFDENGIWQDDRYLTPGSMGTPALDIMNVMQSGQNYQKNMALKALQEMLAVGHDPNAPAAFQSPQMATATGLPQADVDQFYGNMPSTQARSQLGQLPLDQQTDPEQIQRIGMLTGAEPFSAGTASSVKLNESYRKSQSGINSNATRVLNAARTAADKLTDPTAKASVGEGIIRSGYAQLNIDPETTEAAVKAWNDGFTNMKVDPLIQAKIDGINAMKDYREVNTSLLPAHVQAQIAALDAQTRIHDIDAQLKNVDFVYAKQGKINPEAAAKISAQIAEKEATLEGMSGMTLMMAGGSPESKAMVDAYMRVQKKTLEQEKQKLAAVSGTGLASAPTAFPDVNSYRAAYRQKHGADPTPDNIAKAQAQGLVPAGQ